MKYVFLDIDGVLNDREYLFGCTGMCDGDASRMIDPVKVERLNTIVRETGAFVVVSSSWRHGHSLTRLRDMLVSRGFAGDVVDVTPSGSDSGLSGHWQRGDEISLWLSRHQHDEFVVLDDDDDMAGVADHLVKTSFAAGGLMQVHVDRAIEMLGRIA